MSGGRRGSWLTLKVRKWLERAEAAYTLKKCGGDQRCPWCQQWMNQFDGTRIEPFTGNSMMDEITCGNCFGTSLWKWEVGFFFVMAADPPPSSLEEAPNFLEPRGFIEGVIKRAREHLDNRYVARRVPNAD